MKYFISLFQAEYGFKNSMLAGKGTSIFERFYKNLTSLGNFLTNLGLHRDTVQLDHNLSCNDQAVGICSGFGFFPRIFSHSLKRCKINHGQILKLYFMQDLPLTFNYKFLSLKTEKAVSRSSLLVRL